MLGAAGADRPASGGTGGSCPRARALPARSQRISSGRTAAACMWRAAGGRSGRAEAGGGTCTRGASLRAGPGGAALRKRRAQRGRGGAGRRGDTCARGALPPAPRGRNVGGASPGGAQAAPCSPPPPQNKRPTATPRSLASGHPEHRTVAFQGEDVQTTRCPEWGRGAEQEGGIRGRDGPRPA